MVEDLSAKRPEGKKGGLRRRGNDPREGKEREAGASKAEGDRDGSPTRLRGRGLTYSVTLRAGKTSCASFTGHSLKARSALATWGSGGTSITLGDNQGDWHEAWGPRSGSQPRAPS